MIGTTSKIKSASIEAVVLNADGSVKKRLGVISFWHINPFRRMAFWLRRRVQENFS